MSFKIETGRLIIRDVLEDDIPILVKQFAEPEAQKNILYFQADETYNISECVKPRCPNIEPYGTPKEKPTTSASGMIAQTAVRNHNQPETG